MLRKQRPPSSHARCASRMRSYRWGIEAAVSADVNDLPAVPDTAPPASMSQDGTTSFVLKNDCWLMPDKLIGNPHSTPEGNLMGREHSLKTTPFLFTIATAALLASTSLVYAIDPNASAALQKAPQQVAAQAQNTQERIARMEDQIARMNEELIALSEQKIQAQREPHATNELR